MYTARRSSTNINDGKIQYRYLQSIARQTGLESFRRPTTTPVKLAKFTTTIQQQQRNSRMLIKSLIFTTPNPILIYAIYKMSSMLYPCHPQAAAHSTCHIPKSQHPSHITYTTSSYTTHHQIGPQSQCNRNAECINGNAINLRPGLCSHTLLNHGATCNTDKTD